MGVSLAPGAESPANLPSLLVLLRTLWSEVIFPGRSTLINSGRCVLLCELILLLVAASLCYARLDCPLQEPEEALYAEIPRQMLAEGRWLVPVRHGQAYYDKPPLLYWLIMGIYQLYGIHDWAARLLPSSAAFLCIVVTYAWGKCTIGARGAFAAAMMLCLSPRFAQMARMVTMNGLLTLWVSAALATAHLALSGSHVNRRWWLLSALACGLGFMTKGPVALALVVVPVLLFQLLDRRCPLPGVAQWFLYGAVVGSIALPWFVVLAIRDPDFIPYFVWIHHVQRVLDPIDHPQPFWYYGPQLLLGMMPWTLLLPGLVKHLAARSAPEAAQRTSDLGFFLLAALWGLIFFSASGCKRPCYILPVMPPLALALGSYVETACGAGWLRRRSWACAAAASFLLLWTTGEWLLPWYADRFSVRDRIAPCAEECSEDVRVLCYPHIWDGVSYYLQRNDVRVFRQTQLEDMVTALQGTRRSLVVVKEDESLDRFLRALPETLEFVSCRRQHPVAVGWVQQRK
jgi:dolichol-phosphate mannosyltransferase